MPDRTKEFRDLVSKNEFKISRRPNKSQNSKKNPQLASFMQEANVIYNVLRILKTQPANDDDFQDGICLCQEKIEGLENVTAMLRKKLERDTEYSFFKLMSVREPPGPIEDLVAHTSSITWYLNKRLLGVTSARKEKQERFLSRDEEKRRDRMATSISYKATRRQQILDIDTYDMLDEQENVQVPPEYLQELQEIQDENQAMTEQLNHTLNETQRAGEKLMEISALHTQIMSHISDQSVMTQRLHEDAITTNDRVDKGNKQLHKTQERNQGTRKFVLAFLIGASIVLLFLDWYS